MTLRGLALDDIEELHLDALVANAVPELRAIEYKSALPGRSDNAGKEFLADVCSFANAGGGEIIYGVEEENGAPVGLPGVPMPDPDTEVLRLESTILSGLDPRLVGFGSQPVPLSNGNHALLLRIPRSFGRPHAVNYKNRFRYYGRNSAGKYEMDATEVRNAVLASESIFERVRSFRAERLASISSGREPISLAGPGRAVMVLHLLPLSAFDVPAPQVDLTLADEPWDLLRTLGSSGNAPRYNFDGLIRVATYPESGPRAYTQLFRNGAIEAANSGVLERRPERAPAAAIPGVAFEWYVLEILPGYLALLERLGATPPVLAMLSLLDVKGYEMLYSERFFDHDDLLPIDRDDLIVSEVVFDGFGSDFQTAAARMRPAFDAVWNACGLPLSPNYGPDDRWRERR